MWYFLIKQAALDLALYRDLSKRATRTDIEVFNEPYENWAIFSVEKDHYPDFMDYLDRMGIAYELNADRPSRSDILTGMA